MYVRCGNAEASLRDRRITQINAADVMTRRERPSMNFWFTKITGQLSQEGPEAGPEPNPKRSTRTRTQTRNRARLPET